MFIVQYRNFLYIFSGVVLAVAVLGMTLFGLRPGVDFSGGAILEVEFLNTRPEISAIEKRLSEAEFSSFRVQPSGENEVLIRLGEFSQDSRAKALSALAGENASEEVLVEKRFDAIGPTIGRELRKNSFISIGLVIILILAFVSWVFRHVSRPVASWKYGVVAIIALVHDITIPAGLFAYLGKFYGAEVDALFVTALLTILGFSVHDTIVVFDRIRENLKDSGGSGEFEKVVWKSLNETFGRSLATSGALFLVLGALFWFGAEATRHFALTLLVGVVAGTYSSICLASPLLVSWQKFRKR